MLDERGDALHTHKGMRFHPQFWSALRMWMKENWVGVSPERCFDWFPARAMRFGLDAVHTKHQAKLKKQAKARKEHARSETVSRAIKLGNKVEPQALLLADSPGPLRQNPGSPRLRRSDIPRHREKRPPLVSYEDPPPIPDGAYKRLMSDRPVRWGVYRYVCEELSRYGERRDREAFDRFLGLITCFWMDRAKFQPVPGNPDAVTVRIFPVGQPQALMTVDLNGLDF